MEVTDIIHLTTRDKSNLSALFQENLDLMRQYYPASEIRIYDDADIDDFVSNYDREYYDRVFVKLPSQIMRVDTVRYLWMEAFGGMYFDFDIRLQRRWEPGAGAVLVEREWTYPEAKDITVSVHNCVFSSSPGHALWRHLLDGIAAHVKKSGMIFHKWPSVFDVTGPNAISRTITREKLTTRLDDVHILPANCIYQDGASSGTPDDAIFIHQTAGSWKG